MSILHRFANNVVIPTAHPPYRATSVEKRLIIPVNATKVAEQQNIDPGNHILIWNFQAYNLVYCFSTMMNSVENLLQIGRLTQNEIAGYYHLKKAFDASHNKEEFILETLQDVQEFFTAKSQVFAQNKLMSFINQTGKQVRESRKSA